MTKFSLIAAVAVLSMINVASWNTVSAEPIRLRVLSYNIHHGEGVDGKRDLPRIANVIRSVQPDLVALQEVDQNAKRSGNVDQPQKLGRLTQMNVAFGPNIKLQGGHYGNAILSRFPIATHANHRLPNLDDGEQRGVLAAEISVPKIAEKLLILATHFDHRRNQDERIQSAQAINVLLKDDPRPALLIGDLNDVLGSEPLGLLRKQWTVTNADAMPTIPVAKPTRQIDFILFRPGKRWRAIETTVLHEAVASDHRAIFSVLELSL
ncbi:endonuclease/exonuclease/phosphatase family protein [Planctomycetes bacterium K23_9]|uniref:Endonuclease/Exonuclease/phosphatase family protein n=1 Tax=Stieleria marina TaxID=1930275 RepID=A0A517NR79_9BACT|nr:Endonuclease/Exonuclease/phosphatase family protein [Planctomycetes bacterium K23_9]